MIGRSNFILSVLLLTHYLVSNAQIYTMTNSSVTVCSGTFYDSGGAGGNYANNQNFSMTFYPAIAGNFIQIVFLSFDVQDNYDLLYVYDGNSTSAPLIGIYTSNTLPGTVTASSSNITGSLTFSFTSNGFTNRPGWSASISCGASGIPVYAMQNGIFNTCNARFYDTGGPNQTYNWNENSTITFCPDAPNTCISIKFNPISLELDYDYLYIYDGNSVSAPLISKFGDNASAQTFSASVSNSSGCLTVKFVSDGWDDRAGWDATVSCVPCATIQSYGMDVLTNSSITGCQFILTDNGGAMGNYLNNSTEFTKICSNNPLNPYVNITITQFDFEKNYDWLRVYDGPSATYPLIGAYTGTIIPGMISSTDLSGCLYIEQISDGGNNRSGFVGIVSCSNIKGLPIELKEFSGKCENNSITLLWETASEKNNSHFVVQRSNNAVDFDSIGIVKGFGNSNINRTYVFNDLILDDLSYYRIKQVDYNGHFNLSNLIALSCEDNVDFSFTVSNTQEPNVIMLNITGLKQLNPFVITIYNQLGQILFNEEKVMNEASNHIFINSQVANGIYLMKIEGQNKIGIKKFIR